MNSHNVAQPTTVTPTSAAATAAAHSLIGTNFDHKYPASSSLLSLLLSTTMPHLTSSHATIPTPQPETVKQQHKQQQYQEKQRAYVNALVDVTVQAIASIWPNATSSTPASNNRPIANLNTFLHHILKHSRTTHSTLQLAIFYLFRIRPRVLERRNDDVYISCGRRMFLAALICAHKFLQDKTYKNSAWSKVSGLSVSEVNHAEKVMLQLLDWSLYVKKDTYDQWILMLQNHLKVRVPPQPAHPPKEPALDQAMEWQKPKIPEQKTVIALGMPTPVEEVANIKHALPCMVSLLSSPPEKRKASSDSFAPAAKRRHA